MSLHPNKKQKITTSDKILKSNQKTEFIKRDIHVPLIDGKWDQERMEIWDHFRHKETGVVVVRVMIMHPPETSWNGQIRNYYLQWLCPELGGGNASLSYWIMLAKQSPRKSHG